MSLLDFLIPTAYAQSAGGQPRGGGFGMLLFPVILIAIMYFLMIRPQMKRQKEHKGMLDKLSRGDEVITSGGVARRGHRHRRQLRHRGSGRQRAHPRAEERHRQCPAQGHPEVRLILPSHR